MNRARFCAGVFLALFACAIAGCAPRRESGPSSWFMNQRRSVDGTIPVRAHAAALERLDTEKNATVVPGSWVNVGPTNIGGRVTALGVDPNNPSRMWAGTAAGGVFRSTDDGNNWSPVFDGQTALSIGSLAVHPTLSDTVYVGTGEDNGGGFSYDGEGVFRTTDGGSTWTSLGLAEVRRIGKITIDAADPSRIFVAAGGDWFQKDVNRGIYRSIDGGAHWTQVLFVADDTGGIDVVIDPVNPSRVFATVWQRSSAGSSWYIGGVRSGIYRSLDGGTTWTKLVSGLPTQPGRIGIALAPTNHLTMYAVIITATGGLDGIYRSLDGGDTWAKRSQASVTGQFSAYSYYFGRIRVDPANENTVYALDYNLLRSTNAGQSFSAIATSVHVDWHDLIFATTARWLAGTDGGFFRSVNSGSTWTKATTLQATQLYDLGISYQNPQVRFAGAQDNGSVRTTTGASSGWSVVLGGDGLQCEVDPVTPSRVYCEYQFGEINSSTNGGAGFGTATAGIDQTDRVNWNAPITLDPLVPTTLYTGTFRVYRSIDATLSWNPISGDLSHGQPAAKSHLMNLVHGTITVVSVSRVDTNVLWAGTDDGRVWVSTDRGAIWNVVTPPGAEYWVTDIEPSRFDAGTAYLTVTGYRSGDSLPYVRVTRDYGATWNDLSAGLPQVPVSTILPSAQWRGRLFAGDDVGVYLSDDDGATWAAIRGGMPYVVVMDLVEHTPSHTLFAATHARSIYSYDLAQLPPADGDGDGADNNADCALADPGAHAVPAEVGSLQVAGSGLSWPSLSSQAGPGTTYDVARGPISGLAVSGTSEAATLGCSVAGTSLADAAPVTQPDGVYYLVRGRNACGLGSWGADSTGAPRTVSACP